MLVLGKVMMVLWRWLFFDLSLICIFIGCLMLVVFLMLRFFLKLLIRKFCVLRCRFLKVFVVDLLSVVEELLFVCSFNCSDIVLFGVVMVFC